MGEVLHCEAQKNNIKDHYAVAACQENNTVVGHIPRKTSRVCWLFLNKPSASGNKVFCCVTGVRRYSNDLPQVGLEIPCMVKFISSEPLMIQKVHTVLKAHLKRMKILFVQISIYVNSNITEVT